MAAEAEYCYLELGWSEHRIGAYLDRNPYAILAALKRRGVPIRPSITNGRNGRPLKCDADRIVALGRQGMTPSIIVQRTGATLNQVRYHLDKAGIPRRPQVTRTREQVVA